MKTSSLGDVIHHCPAVSDAARHVPGLEIDWVVEEAFVEIAAMHSRVRRVIPVAMRRWRNALWNPSVWSEIGVFRRSLANQHYDIVVDSQGLLKSAVICRLASGTVHGMDRSSAREPMAAVCYDVTHEVAKNLHAIERNRRLTAKALGYAAQGSPVYGLGIPDQPPASREAQFGVLLTMSSRSEKLWPDALWIELGRALGTRLLLPWGSAGERLRAQSIAAAIPGAVVPERMSFRELGKLFVQSSFVIGVDTGLAHLAVALGVPTIGIFCGTEPALYGLSSASSKALSLGGVGRSPSVAEVLDALK